MLDCVRTFLLEHGRAFRGLYLPLSWAVVLLPSRVTKCVSGACFYSILVRFSPLRTSVLKDDDANGVVCAVFWYPTFCDTPSLNVEWRGANDFLFISLYLVLLPSNLCSSASTHYTTPSTIVLHRNSSAPAIMSSPPPACYIA